MNVMHRPLPVALVASFSACGGLATEQSFHTNEGGPDGTTRDAGQGDVGADVAKPDASPGDAALCRSGGSCTGTLSGGHCLTTLASGQDNPVAMASNGTSVCWLTANGDVMRVSVCGGVPTTLALGKGGSVGLSTRDSVGIAVDALSAYWTSGQSVMKVPLGGGKPTTLASTSKQEPPNSIAVDATSVYWTAFTGEGDGIVAKVPLNGGSVVTLAPQPSPSQIAVNASGVYWVNELISRARGRSVMSMSLSGGSVTTISAPENRNGSGPISIAVGSASVFWGYLSDSDDAGPFMSGALMSAPLGGGSTVTLASGLLGIPVRMLVDDENLYWTARGAYPDDLLPGAPTSMPLTGGTPAPLFPNVGDAGNSSGSPSAFAIDEVSIYWASSTAILRLTPK